MVNREKDAAPLYLQVEKYIKEWIAKNGLKPGDVLPTEAELEAALNVSRTTIRSAISDLQYSGYVTKQQGKGTFVAHTAYEEQLPLLKSFTEDAIARESVTYSIVLGNDIILPDEELAQKLKIKPNNEVFKLSRVRYIDNEPLQITISYLSVKELKKMDFSGIDFTVASLYKSIEDAGIILFSGEERMEVDLANPLDIALLGVEVGSPIFVTKRIVFDENGTIIEYANSRTRGDRHKVVIKLKR